MSPRHITAAAALVATLSSSTLAFADKLLVLKADGRADAKIRARVDTAVAKLAQSGTDQATVGEVTYPDAAAMVGCKPEDTSCRDEVLGMLGVDEIVMVTVTPRAGGFDVMVRRAGKNGAARDASTLVEGDAVEKLDALGTLFGLAPVRTTPPVGTQPAITTTTTTTTTTGDGGELVGPATPEEPPPSTIGPPTTPTPTPTPGGPVGGEPSDLGSSTNRLHIAGMVTGGALLLVGLVAWGSAASTQSDIDAAPDKTADDIVALMDLEKRGDNAAALGNLFVLGGLVIGGISTVLYVRHRKAHPSSSMSARLAPTLMNHGAGLVLTFGGTP